MIDKGNLNLKWFICFLLHRHNWGYYFAGAKDNYNCTCDMNGGCSSISVYDLVCLRCGFKVTLGEDELIDCFAKRLD